jgi:DNA-binding NarL/FixJ family response regulator
METRKRVLLVDDQKLFVDSLRLVIDSRSEELEVVGVAYDGISALEMTSELDPDLVVLDVRMPNMDGVETIKLLKKANPSLRVLMLTTFDDDEQITQALGYGAVGYLLKDMAPDDLINAMRTATEENVQLSSSVIQKLLNPKIQGQIVPETNKAIPPVNDTIGKITPREADILHLIADGYNNNEIAEKLKIAVQTVKNRVSEMYFKFDVHDRLHLMRKAKELGFGRRTGT